MGSTLLSIGRFICGLIDSVVYVVISKMYDVFYDVANIFLYSEDIFEVIGQRIGLVLGIFMLFRLAISLVSYLISPDKLNDNSKGGGKMITNIILSLVLLVTVNIIFEQAYKVQNQIVQSRFIEKIFFGSKASAPNLDTAYVLYSSFITPDLNGCEDLFDPYMEMSDDCANSLSAIKNNDVTNLIKNDILKNYKLNKLLSNYDALNYKNAGVYVFDYLPILSTVAGVAVVLVLISFSMDLATRAVKLLFLQIIAPIPIIANIDPGKGSEVFKKWYKECFSTYLSLFIRIIAINFAVFMITLIKTEFHNIFRGKSALITALLVIGCLMFAKQVPKLIEDLLGIKMDGMALKPLKKFQEQALFGKQISGVTTGAVAGTASGLRAAGANAIVSPGAGGRILGAGAGFASAFSKGLAGGFKGEKFGKNFTNSYNIAMENKERRLSRKDDDVGFWEMEHNKLQRSAHQKTRGQRADELDKALESYKKNGEAIKNAIYANDKASFRFVDSRGQRHDFAGAKGLKEFIDNMQGPTQAPGESPESFAQRQEEFIKYKNEFKDELDRQVSNITTGRRNINDNNGGRSGGAAAQASIKKMLDSMNEQLESINKEGTALYGNDFNTIGSATAASANNMSMKNSLGAATGAQTTISSHAGHDRDVDKYGAKKDAK